MMYVAMNTKELYLSQDNTNCLKAIFALLVLMHHVFQYSNTTTNIYISVIFQSMGYLSVSIFFFLSGYGLQTQYKKKQGDYLNSFWSQRIIPYYFICVFSAFLYIVYDLIFKVPFSIVDVFCTLTYGKTLIVNGWFLQALLVLYFLFYVSNRFFKKEVYIYLFWCVAVVAYCFINYMCSNTTTKFEAILPFVFGIAFSQNKDRFNNIIFGKRKYLNFFMVTGLFFLFFVVGNSNVANSEFLRIVSKMLSTIAFVLLVLFCISRVPINNKITRFIGDYYLEIYIMQGFPLKLFQMLNLNKAEPILYCFAVIICTFLFSLVFHPVYKKIQIWTKNILQKEKLKYNLTRNIKK